MDGERIQIEEISLPVKVIVDRSRKNFKIIVSVEGITIYSPVVKGKINFHDLLKSREGWIYKSYNRLILNSSKAMSPRNWESGEKILYKGNIQLLDTLKLYTSLEEINNIEKVGIKLEEEKIIIYDNKYKEKLISITLQGDCFIIRVFVNLEVNLRKKLIEKAFKLWFEERAKVEINTSLEHHKNIVGVSFGQVRIKEQKTLWGSCSSKKNLNFNWKLIFAPIEVLNYIVVHELCHIKEMNHSKYFWNEVSKVMPDYQRHRKYLKDNIFVINNWDKNTN